MTDNKIVHQIVASSSEVASIIHNLKKNMPEIFKVASPNVIRDSIVKYICDPTSLKAESKMSKKFVGIVESSLPKLKGTKTYDKNVVKIRSKLYAVVKGKTKSREFEVYLGCTKEELLEHLEYQFDMFMTWENYGSYWHVDHIRPVCSFDLGDQAQQKECSHYTNLRPLSAVANIAKAQQDKKLSLKRKAFVEGWKIKKVQEGN